MLNEADQDRWHGLESRIDGRYPMLGKMGRARIVGQFLRTARRAGSRHHGEQRFVFPDGDVVFDLLTHGRDKGRWQVADDVPGVTIGVTILISPGSDGGPDAESDVVECTGGFRSEVHLVPAHEGKAWEPLQKALAACWSHLKDGPSGWGRALALMQSLEAHNMDGAILKALSRS
jgi:hypothetical protein